MILAEGNQSREELSGCWPKVYRYYAVNYPFYEMDMHAHAEWEIMYIAHGKCRVSYQTGGAGREVSLREGDYILLGGMVMHRLTVERGTPCRILNMEARMEPGSGFFRMEMLKEGLLAEKKSFGQRAVSAGEMSARQEFMQRRERVFIGKDDGSLYRTMEFWLREQSSGPKERYSLSDMLLAQLLVILDRQMSGARRQQQSGILYVRRAMEYLAQHFDREITVEEVAEKVGISEGYLQRLFKRETGMSVMDRVLSMRVEKAKLLLENSTLPIIDIAVNVGFNSRQHFTEIFRSRTGCAPAQWRKSNCL